MAPCDRFDVDVTIAGFGKYCLKTLNVLDVNYSTIQPFAFEKTLETNL